MLRRRTFIYAIAFVMGMASGFLFLECGKYLISSLMIAFSVIVILYINLECDETQMDRERMMILLFLIAGTILFSFTYFRMNSAITDETGRVIPLDSNTHIECTVCSIEHRNSGEKDKNVGYRIIVKPENIKGSQKVQVSYYGELKYKSEIYEYLGRKIEIYGKIGKAAEAVNPGCFNYRNYLYSRNINYTMSAKTVKLISSEKSLLWKYRTYIARLREKFLTYFDSDNVSAFIKGVIFGDKTDIDEDTLQEFNQNSTGHILAVSGLHVGFLFALLRILTRKKKSLFITLLIILILFVYAEMTGWSASTTRAVLVLGLSLLSVYARRPADLLTSVSVAAIIILTINPYQLINSGFQMSMLALLSICFLSKPLSYFAGEYLGSLLAIQIGMLPIAAYTFGGFNPLSILINIPIVFLSSLLVPMCITGLMILIASGNMPLIFADAISVFSEILIRVNEFLNFGGKFYFNTVSWNTGVIVAVYSLLYFISSEWVRVKVLRKQGKIIRRMLVFIMIPAIFVVIGTWNPFLNDDVVFVSVGQGDATHIRSDGHNLMIDGGGNREYNVGKKVLKPYLLKNGVSEVDLALVTHLHTDHYQGLTELNEVYPIGGILTPNELSCGDRISISKDTYIEVIWPLGRVKMTTENANEDNMVYIIHLKGKKIMVTGDLLEEDEKKMVDHYRGTDKLKCDVLKVAHHGSKSSSCEEFLDAAKPDIAVISVGKNNMYGHPHQQTLNRLEKRGIKVYRTDLNGAVGIRGTYIKCDFPSKGVDQEVKSRSLKVDIMQREI